ncbi:MAG: translation initiation factor IF-2 [Gammaproteobacteria bacterium]|nr:translation initiation factor IF-2 [Gammaproteobacteria bacterium]
MAEMTVKQLAETVGTPVDRLLQQMNEADLPQKVETDSVTEGEKEKLLSHLKRSHGETGEAPKKITLKRRTVSTIKAGGNAGRGRTVNVEVRKKRTYVRREEQEPTVSDVEEAAPAVVVAETETVPDAEAIRKAAQAEAELEAGKRHQESLERAAELKAEEEAKELEKTKKAEFAKAKVKTQKADPDKEAEDKPSSRKDKRDRSDLDLDDLQQKKAKHGNRKKRVEELLSEEVEEILETSDAAVQEEEAPRTLGLSGGARNKRAVAPKVGRQHQFSAPAANQTREVELGESITVQQLSQRMSVKARDVIKYLMSLDVMVDINESIDQATATLVVEEYGHTVKVIDADDIENTLTSTIAYASEAEPRAPVVTVMGHVDHGKTSLLDYIRKAQVASGEAGGITQHIGAYRVQTDHGEICFIDTPGHAAFTAMRARGANCTDIVILVVAADDGVMPQTQEAVTHARAAGVPIVVAINKIDLEGADQERVKSELAAKDVIPEDWGGDTQFIPVSAITGEGVDALLEAVLLQAELLELSAYNQGTAQGIIIESRLEKGRGAVATLLVQNGTLKQGDIVVAGENYGRARAINDEHGKKVKAAGPATPVSLLGLDGTPAAGDTFTVTKDEKTAREVAQFRRSKVNAQRLSTPVVSLDNLLANFGEAEVKALNIVVKADVRGSLEAIVSALTDLGNDEVKVNVVFAGVGGISDSDINYAITSEAVVFGFNVRAENSAKKIIEAEGLDLRYYKVIYDLVDDVKAALTGLLDPEIREEIIGIAEVKDVFDSKKFGSIAGCMVMEGTIEKQKKIRVLRNNIVIYEGELESLRHFKEEVNTVRSGTECGIGVKNYNDVQVKDQIEVFDTREVARQL